MQIHPSDNVEVRDDGQKYALKTIKADENVIKYGYPIGSAKCEIQAGEKVSPKNLRSNLQGMGEWTYTPAKTVSIGSKTGEFMGYLRKNGDVGIRNELWIVPTVGCINDIAKSIAEKTGGKALTHPYGCSQLGNDLHTTQKILCGLIKHPNAGGVLVLGLGCEENGIGEMIKVLGDYDKKRIRFINIQDCKDEIAEGIYVANELKAIINTDKKTPVPISKLRIAVKCGGSDGYSGITANPLVGRAMEKFADYGATILMSEIPEVFGAEQLLLSRSENEEVFNEVANLIRAFRKYFIDHGEGISDNP